MKNYSRELFLKKLKVLQFPQYSEFIDINAAYSHFLQLISSVIDEIAPVKEIRVRNNNQEWMDEEVLEGVRIRDKLLSKFKRTKTHMDHFNYRRAWNNVLHSQRRRKIVVLLENGRKILASQKNCGKALNHFACLLNKICLKTDGEHCFDDKINSFYQSTTFLRIFSQIWLQSLSRSYQTNLVDST